MPSLNISVGPLGPLVQVTVGISIPKQAALKAAGLALPAMAQGQFLIDTGASGTVVDSALIAKLGASPTGAVNIHTPSTNGVTQSCNQYDVMLFIPGAANLPGCLIEAVAVIEAPLACQGIDGLIGRDLLDRWTSVYNGSAGMFTICY
jgi:hypothetical protein